MVFVSVQYESSKQGGVSISKVSFFVSASPINIIGDPVSTKDFPEASFCYCICDIFYSAYAFGWVMHSTGVEYRVLLCCP
jgi:hypothetical protein